MCMGTWQDCRCSDSADDPALNNIHTAFQSGHAFTCSLFIIPPTCGAINLDGFKTCDGLWADYGRKIGKCLTTSGMAVVTTGVRCDHDCPRPIGILDCGDTPDCVIGDGQLSAEAKKPSSLDVVAIQEERGRWSDKLTYATQKNTAHWENVSGTC